jgi:hypothetical protein
MERQLVVSPDRSRPPRGLLSANQGALFILRLSPTGLPLILHCQKASMSCDLKLKRDRLWCNTTIPSEPPRNLCGFRGLTLGQLSIARLVAWTPIGLVSAPRRRGYTIAIPPAE